MSSEEVLVVGAGPTGLTMAIELARRGIDVRVIDKAAEPNSETRALGVQARTLELYARNDVTPELLPRGLRADRFNVFSEGRRILRADFGALPTPYPFLLMIPQNHVEEVLARRLHELGVTVERELSLTRILHRPGKISATIQPAAGGAETRDYQWVIGADGARSTVRKLLNVGFLGTAFDEGFAVADLRMDWDRPPTEFFAFLNSGRFAAFFPMLGGWHRVAIAQPPGAAPDSDRTISRFDLQAAIDQTVPGRPSIAELRQAGRFRINQRRAAAHRVGRVFLAGDAAHIHSVIGAQGMNTGIQDAFNLGWKLAEVIKGTADETLLDSYEAERAPVAARLVRGTRMVTRMTLIRNSVATAARRAVAPRILGRAHTQAVLTRAISQLDVSYHDKTGASPAGRVLAGDRAPDAAISVDARAARIYELLHPVGFTLLVFGIEDKAIAPLLDDHPSLTAVVRITPDAEAHAAYDIDRPTVVLVRPDGYIAARGDVTQVRAYFDEVGLGTTTGGEGVVASSRSQIYRRTGAAG
jgi:2-polyprenyl-6-methoxyphenol hydroxylase-like FAD-dependent oxidoreductase